MNRLRGFLFAAVVLLLPAYVAAVDGVVLINQASVMAAGGFPYTITQPGSYKLSGNLVAPAGVNGIVIAASNVTLDLNGFSIEGPQQTCTSIGCSTLFGIGIPFAAGQQRAITVKNGTVVGFGAQMNLLATYSHVDNVILLQGTGGNVSGGSNFFASTVLHHLISDGNISLECPGVVSESVAPNFLRQGNAVCVFTGSSGNVF